MEGCDHCANHQYGCCEDELTPALGPNKEVNKSIYICLQFQFSYPRAVAVRVPNMVAVWTEAQQKGQTSRVVSKCLEKTVTCHHKKGPALTLLTSGSLTSIMVSKWSIVTF